MPKIFEYPYSIKLPLPHKEEAEFGYARSGIGMCKECMSFYYTKAWHHDAPSFPYEMKNEELLMRLLLCPACRMVKDKMYEGKLVIEHVPERSADDLEKMIHSYGARAYEKDCQHRLVDVQRIKDYIIVTTTENQLATRLAKKIKDAFNRVYFRATYSKAPSDVSFVKMSFIS